MEIPIPFGIGKREPVKIRGWHITLGSLFFLLIFAVVLLQTWGDTKPFPKVVGKAIPVDKQLKFSISSEFQDDLENGVVSVDLRREFRSNEVDLSDNAKAFTEEKIIRWFIADGSQLYDVTKGTTELEIGLSDNAKAFTAEEASKWSIADGGQVYNVTKGATGLVVDKQFSFGVDLEFQHDFDDGRISQQLLEEFNKHGVVLSDNARVSTLERDNQWEITDRDSIYVVTNEDNRLNVDQQELLKKDVFIGDPIANGVDDATSWITREGSFLFDRISDVIKEILIWLEDTLRWLPWPVLITAIALLAWRMAGLYIGIFSALVLLLIGFTGLWESSMETLALMLTSVIISVVIAVPVGIMAARNNAIDAILRPVLDMMQTMPSFVYLVPAIFFFGLGNVPAVVATIIYAVPPAIRLTNLGIRQVSPETVEAARAFGATPLQLLLKVQIPLALPTIMAGINQTIMMALAMVVVASLVGGGGLGEDVLKAIGRLEVGNSLLAGLGIVILAIILDRITQGYARTRERATQE